MLVERLRADGAGEPHIGGGAVVYRSMEHSGGDSGGQCDVDYACPRTVCPGSNLGSGAVGGAAVPCGDACWLFTSTYVPGDNQVESSVGLELADQRETVHIVSYRIVPSHTSCRLFHPSRPSLRIHRS